MPRKHNKMCRTQHYITQNQMDALASLSANTGCGVSEHLRRALDEYFKLPEVVPHLNDNPDQLEMFPE